MVDRKQGSAIGSRLADCLWPIFTVTASKASHPYLGGKALHLRWGIAAMFRRYVGKAGMKDFGM